MLYRLHELAYRTQYAELKDRARATSTLLPGTPGTLYRRDGTGYAYWYRVYYAAPGIQAEDLVAADGDADPLKTMQQEIEFAQWMSKQVSDLRKLEFQVADKAVARVLVELSNKGAFEAGLVLVGTLGYMAWLNELGARAVAARTQDLDLARRQALKLAAPLPFLATVQATKLPFVAVPGLPSQSPPTSLKLAGREGLRVDLLAPGRTLGAARPVPELEWHAQSIPHYDYLLDAPVRAAMLAGGHCVPLLLPASDRLIWHKLYSSGARQGSPERSAKDLRQAVTLGAIETEQHDLDLVASLAEAPAAVRSSARKRLPAVRAALAGHPQALDQFERALS